MMTCIICGNEFSATPREIRNGRKTCSRPCGLMYSGQRRTRDLTGEKINHLTVLGRAPSRQGRTQKKTRWSARCDCGVVVEVDGADLYRTDGRARVSCGCWNWRKKAESAHWKGGGFLSGRYMASLRGNAKARGYSFNITFDYLEELLRKQEYRCALSGVPLSLEDNASLDRIDSSRGYEPDNVQWVDKEVNLMKRRMTDEDFIEVCRKVVAHRG